MALDNQRPDTQLIQAWRPAGSCTTLWAHDMEQDLPLYLVQQGDTVYLPTTEGLWLGIGIYNGASRWMAYPTFIEAANLYVDGPSMPDDCTPEDMWEVRPRTDFMMDALMDRNGQIGRPLIIVPHGRGMGIGEATYGTDQYRGQIRVYERMSSVGTVAAPSQPQLPNIVYQDEPYGSIDMDEARRTATSPSAGTMGINFGNEAAVGTDHQVGIGAGAEEQRLSHYTGVRYSQGARLVAALRVESRDDLAGLLRTTGHSSPEWHWRPSGSRWFTTWSAQRIGGLMAPHIPVAPAPHQPYGINRSAH